MIKRVVPLRYDQRLQLVNNKHHACGDRNGWKPLCSSGSIVSACMRHHDKYWGSFYILPLRRRIFQSLRSFCPEDRNQAIDFPESRPVLVQHEFSSSVGHLFVSNAFEFAVAQGAICNLPPAGSTPKSTSMVCYRSLKVMPRSISSPFAMIRKLKNHTHFFIVKSLAWSSIWDSIFLLLSTSMDLGWWMNPLW